MYLVTALNIALSLIVSGNVELNSGPMKKCPKCEKMMATRYIVDAVIYYAICCREGSALQCILYHLEFIQVHNWKDSTQ